MFRAQLVYIYNLKYNYALKFMKLKIKINLFLDNNFRFQKI